MQNKIIFQKFDLSKINELKEVQVMNQLTSDWHKSVSWEIEQEIKKRLTAAGYDINDLNFIKDNFQFVHAEGHTFKHLMNIVTKERIISIQALPTIQFIPDGTDFIDNKITATIEYKYY